MNKKPIIFLSCEHAVNTIPPAYQAIFAEHSSLINSHRGIDFGALGIAEQLAKQLTVELITAKTSRLLIDFNRSLTHPTCFSEVTTGLADNIKQAIITNYYQPYREAIESFLRSAIDKQHRVIHLSIHSFTPELHGIKRNTDIGLLYDPKRPSEKIFATRWKQQLHQQQTTPLRVRLNYPYQGTSDGLTTAMRKLFPDADYVGIEVECNQAIVCNPQTILPIANLLFNTLPNPADLKADS